MFRWYQKAQVCYAYLSDVSTVTSDDLHKVDSEFHRSLWFTRGWTLQELLAPEIVVFYNRGWIEIGTRSDASELISSITGIAAKILRSPYSASSESVAKTMSWASKRTTTRLEDMAYCLMGLFDVNMPLLYGEGSKAFYRLQLEIIKSSTDQSIFAWEVQDPNADPLGPDAWTLPLFATEPALFQHAGNIEYSNCGDDAISPYTMTNKGLQIQTKLVPAPRLTKADHAEKLLMLTFCYRQIGGSRFGLGIFLKEIVSGVTFVRIRKQLFETHRIRTLSFKIPNPEEETQIYIKNEFTLMYNFKNEANVTSVLLDLSSALEAGFAITKEYENGQMDNNIIHESWEVDFQIIRLPDFRTLHVDCMKPKEMFRITMSTIQRPLELCIEIYQKSPEGIYFKLRSDSHLPSRQVVRAVLKKRMVDGEPMLVVEVLVDMLK
jgi:hypothetical protein